METGGRTSAQGQTEPVRGDARLTRDTLTVIDNRTGRSFEVAVEDGAVHAVDLRQIVLDDGLGLVSYDPGLINTATCRSAITYVDGEAGILQHRGYRIEALCEHSTFLEMTYLLIYGDLPSAARLERWTYEVTTHNFVHENLKSFLAGFRYDAHPMATLAASVMALSSFYPDAGEVHDEGARSARWCVCSRRCRRWPRSRTATSWASPTCIPRTT